MGNISDCELRHGRKGLARSGSVWLCKSRQARHGEFGRGKLGMRRKGKQKMKNKVIAELKRIAAKNDGLLQPETVVDEARPVASPLHSRFEWDDRVAGDAYRIWQARQLIRVVVEVISATGEKENVFVSLTTDRKESGYRVMTEVLTIFFSGARTSWP